jgi:hypothetical protein
MALVEGAKTEEFTTRAQEKTKDRRVLSADYADRHRFENRKKRAEATR